VYWTHPGDTVVVYNGTYGNLNTSEHPGTSTAWITYEAAPGQTPAIHRDGTTENGVTLGNYQVFQGFACYGDANKITFAQAMALGNVNNSITHGNCIGVSATTHHVKILHNHIYLTPGTGIMFLGDYGWIGGNEIDHNAYWDPTAGSGLKPQGSNIAGLAPGKIYVYGNNVHENREYICAGAKTTPPCYTYDGHGILVDVNAPANDGMGTGVAYAGRIEIYNNVVWSNGGVGLIAYRSDHVDFYNNTSYGNNTDQDLYGHLNGPECYAAHSQDIIFYNNICRATIGTGAAMGFDGTTQRVADYNILWNAAGNSLPLGPHDIVADPSFCMCNFPPLAFELTEGSPAFNSGETFLAPTTDYNGAPRNPAMIDRGAFKDTW